MASFPSIKLTYFDASGRAEALRLAFYIGNVPFEDKRIAPAQFGALKESLPLGQLPTLEVNGEVMTQSHAMLRYAGRFSGLYPVTSPYLALKVDELLHGMSEVEEKMGQSFKETDANKKKALREELAKVTIPHYAEIFDARLEKIKQIAAFQTEHVYVHELALYAWTKALRAGYIDHIPTSVVDGYKHLDATFDKIAKHPKVKEWYTLPHTTTPKLKLTYMQFPGRGEPIRLAFFIGGIEFEDERIARDELAKRKPSLPFKQLPVLEVDGEVMAQSFAILRYAGTLSGLYPVTDMMAAYRVDELLAIIDDMFNHPQWGASYRVDTEKQLAMRAELSTGVVSKTFGFLESRVIHNKGPHATGPKLTVADLAIYGVMSYFKSGIPGFPTTIADSYTNLQRVFKHVAEHPKVVEWNLAHNQ